MSVVGVVLAGGAGQRAGLGRNKVLVDLAGRSILERSIAAMAAVVDDVVVVVRDEDAAAVARLVGDRATSIVTGGVTRHASEVAGVSAAAAIGARIVAVHDGARPLVPVALVRRVVEVASGGVAVVPGLPRGVPIAVWPDPASTVVVVDRLLERAPIIGVQTPQAAPVDLLRECMAAVPAREGAAQLDTVEPVLRHRPDVPVVVVAGDPVNIKVTWRADLDRAVHLVEAGAAAEVGTRLRRRPGWPTGGPPPVGLEVDGVVPVTDALRRVEDDRVVAAIDRTSLVDVTGDLLVAPGIIGDDVEDLAGAVEETVAAGTGLRLRRRR